MKADTEIMTEFQINNWHKNKQKQTPLVRVIMPRARWSMNDWSTMWTSASLSSTYKYQNVMSRVKRVASHLQL